MRYAWRSNIFAPTSPEHAPAVAPFPTTMSPLPLTRSGRLSLEVKSDSVSTGACTAGERLAEII